MTANPKLSILMPAYNREKYIAESIESVLNQSFEDYELIIIDDGSKDKTLEIANQFAEDPRIQIIKNECNIGIARTRNKGLNLAKGEYVALLDSDDVWIDKDKLMKQVSFLDQHTNYALVGGAIRHIDTNGNKIKDVIFEQTDSDIRKRLLQHNPFAQSTLMYRKKEILDCGGYNAEYSVCDDYNLWLSIGLKYKLANFSEIFTGYRIHGGNITRTKRLTAASEILDIVKSHSTQYPNSYWGISKAYLRLILSYMRS